MLDVLTIGDLMIDFTSLGTNEAGKLVFERNPGGAPANVASQVARLGGSSGFIGSVGQDEHGLYLIETMKKLGIDVSCLRISDKEATRITFVYLNQGNDRYFSNYQSPRADRDLPEDERYYRQATAGSCTLHQPPNSGNPLRQRHPNSWHMPGNRIS